VGNDRRGNKTVKKNSNGHINYQKHFSKIFSLKRGKKKTGIEEYMYKNIVNKLFKNPPSLSFLLSLPYPYASEL
jgi:hypothetical protein